MTVHRRDAIEFLDGLAADAYDVAFADPPYHRGFAEQVAARWLAVPFATVLGVEHASTETLPEGGDTRRYGSTAITFYRA
jgi:16S rRNA (guanine966-N2)-methyltransferase